MKRSGLRVLVADQPHAQSIGLARGSDQLGLEDVVPEIEPHDIAHTPSEPTIALASDVSLGKASR